jgi:hypothetical protein
MQPEWRRDGKELFYIGADGKMMAVAVISDTGTFETGVPRPLFDVETPEPTAPSHHRLTAPVVGAMHGPERPLKRATISRPLDRRRMVGLARRAAGPSVQHAFTWRCSCCPLPCNKRSTIAPSS